MKSPITTHVLDISLGKPAVGVQVVLELKDSGAWKQLARGATDADGRIDGLVDGKEKLTTGSYRLTFDTGAYFSSRGIDTIFPAVMISFEVSEPSGHYHIPLLLSPFGYSTYRGS